MIKLLLLAGAAALSGCLVVSQSGDPTKQPDLAKLYHCTWYTDRLGVQSPLWPEESTDVCAHSGAEAQVDPEAGGRCDREWSNGNATTCHSICHSYQPVHVCLIWPDDQQVDAGVAPD